MGSRNLDTERAAAAVKKLKQGDDTDEYQSIMEMYVAFSQIYKWTPAEIDEVEIDMIFSYIVALSDDKEKGQYIDEIWN